MKRYKNFVGQLLLPHINKSLTEVFSYTIMPDRVMVAGVALPKSMQVMRILKESGIEMAYPDDRLSFRVLSSTLLRFSTHYGYKDPLNIVRPFASFYLAEQFLAIFVKNPSFHSLVVISSFPNNYSIVKTSWKMENISHSEFSYLNCFITLFFPERGGPHMIIPSLVERTALRSFSL